jgi:anti-anti-sigma regulatory factor
MSAETGELVLEGDLTLARVVLLQKELLHQLDVCKAPELRLVWKAVERVDEAGVQLLHACYLLCQQRGQALQLQSPLPQALQDALHFGGATFPWNPHRKESET